MIRISFYTTGTCYLPKGAMTQLWLDTDFTAHREVQKKLEGTGVSFKDLDYLVGKAEDIKAIVPMMVAYMKMPHIEIYDEEDALVLLSRGMVQGAPAYYGPHSLSSSIDDSFPKWGIINTGRSWGGLHDSGIPYHCVYTEGRRGDGSTSTFMQLKAYKTAELLEREDEKHGTRF